MRVPDLGTADVRRSPDTESWPTSRRSAAAGARVAGVTGLLDPVPDLLTDDGREA